MKKLLFFVLILCSLSVQAQEENAAVTPQAPAYPDAIETKKIEGQKVTFTTDDGLTITGVYEPPAKEAEVQKAVILLHDLGKNKSSYADFTKQLKAHSLGYLAIDLRGHGESAGEAHYTTFDKEGSNNQFNKMVLDVNAAAAFLKEKKIPAENIFITGSGLGANVAAKSAAFNEGLGGVALLTPSTNLRGVLTIAGVRVNKSPLFIASAANVKKNFFEASIIRNIAFITLGAGKVTFLSAYDKEGTAMLDAHLTPALIQWFLTPVLPEVKPDIVFPDIILEETPFDTDRETQQKNEPLI